MNHSRLWKTWQRFLQQTSVLGVMALGAVTPCGGPDPVFVHAEGEANGPEIELGNLQRYAFDVHASVEEAAIPQEAFGSFHNSFRNTGDWPNGVVCEIAQIRITDAMGIEEYEVFGGGGIGSIPATFECEAGFCDYDAQIEVLGKQCESGNYLFSSHVGLKITGDGPDRMETPAPIEITITPITPL